MKTITRSRTRTSLVTTVACLLLTSFGIDTCRAQNNPSIPTTAAQLWENYDPRTEPLETKVVREWTEGNLTLRYVTYAIGAFKGKKATMAAYFAFPTDGKELPALLQIHGGGQRASLREVRRFAARGYACLSVNWGGRPMEDAKPGEPNTDWGAVDPTQKNVQGYFGLLPNEKTIDRVESPRNNNWYLLTIGCRRGLTFLEQQRQVDADRLGVLGHSMGGRLTCLVAGSDSRVKAASPSVGGSGFVHHDLWGLPRSARHLRGDFTLFTNTIAGEAYLPRIKSPLLFLTSTNDFNAPMDFVERGMKTVPHPRKRTVYAPHLNHRFTPETEIARPLWFDAHLKKRLTFPASPKIELKLDSKDGVPVVTVTPDASRPMERVEVYYGYGRDPRNRFWTDAQPTLQLQSSNDETLEPVKWTAQCPVFDLDEPLFVFTNVHYKLAKNERHEGDPGTFVLSAAKAAYPDQLRAAGVKATEKKQVLIDDFKRGYKDWYRLNAGNRHHWFFATRKLVDPRWEAPDGGRLQGVIHTDQPGNAIGVALICHEWRHYTGYRKQVYLAAVSLKQKGKQTFTLAPSDFRDTDGKPLEDWFGITQLSIRPLDKATRDLHANKNTKPARDIAHLQLWKGNVPQLLGLKWINGEPITRRKAYLPRER